VRGLLLLRPLDRHRSWNLRVLDCIGPGARLRGLLTADDDRQDEEEHDAGHAHHTDCNPVASVQCFPS
jgi:hypothetical protein